MSGFESLLGLVPTTYKNCLQHDFPSNNWYLSRKNYLFTPCPIPNKRTPRQDGGLCILETQQKGGSLSKGWDKIKGFRMVTACVCLIEPIPWYFGVLTLQSWGVCGVFLVNVFGYLDFQALPDGDLKIRWDMIFRATFSAQLNLGRLFILLFRQLNII